eukprot:TRINITY_DN2237_c0_g1_i1.p1 TRINITY_DN2237_c0_g1~~TRINITY_DN2237_c0_g1_i1.p1  ORF type:complete len:515 (-),score=104.42 TRINITY_DN2237_c0_g1_i1:120-1664(-)
MSVDSPGEKQENMTLAPEAPKISDGASATTMAPLTNTPTVIPTPTTTPTPTIPAAASSAPVTASIKKQKPPSPSITVTIPSPVTEVSGWVFKEDLGSGAFGKVKKAVHKVTGAEAAIKIIRLARVLNLYKKPDVAKRKLEREMKILTLLNHPNIVKLYDSIEGEDEIYLVMELVKGGQLSTYLLEKKKLDETEARKFFRQLVSGIEYCHGNLITHRDLKLENILLDEKGDCKIADFGFSNMIQPGQLFNTFCGSPLFVPPELILKQAYHGPPVDIWALGVMLFTMVAGYLPFWESKASMQSLLRKVVNGKFTLPKNLSPECADLIQRMLTVDPQKRITIDEIRPHPWVTQGYDGPPPTYLPSTYPVHHTEERILEQLVSMGFDKEAAKEKILKNEHNQATYIYHLLLARARRGSIDESPEMMFPEHNSRPKLRYTLPLGHNTEPEIKAPSVEPTPTGTPSSSAPSSPREEQTVKPTASAEWLRPSLGAALRGVFSLSAKLRKLVGTQEETDGKL